MYDANVTYVIQLFGNILSSHIMARASLSGGIGRSEETLSSDIRDIAAQYHVAHVASEYLTHCGSLSSVDLSVQDLTKRTEGQIGADFILAIRGQDTNGVDTSVVRKVVLLQAKRLDFDHFDHHGVLRYAKSQNQREHAKHMVKTCGLSNAFFIFYHSDAICSQVSVSPQPTSFVPPQLYYARPDVGDHYFIPDHPDLHKAAFIEPSSYRSLYMKRMDPPSWTLPPYFAWGIGVQNADFFVTSTGRARPRGKDLPSVNYVLQNGHTFQDFLLALINCTKATNYPDDKSFFDALGLAVGNIPRFQPRFVMFLQYSSNTSERQIEWKPLPFERLEEEVE